MSKKTFMRKILSKILHPDPKIRNYSLYVIALQEGKYYIGLTARKPKERIHEHGSKKGAAWARKYKPLRPLQIIEIRSLGRISISEALNLENDLAHEYMDKYGKQNVRGGRMTRVGWLPFRTYNPGTPKDILQIVILFGTLLVLVQLCFYLASN